MKQKLISKLKRVVFALFAVLCVGNVWADDNYYGGDTYIKFNPELSQLDVLHEYYVFNNPTTKEVRGRYIYSYEKTETDGTATLVVATNYITGVDHPTSTVNWRKIEGVIDVPGFPLGSVLNVEYQIQHKVNNAWVKFEYYGSDIPPIESWSYDSRGILDSEGGWSNDPEQFIISGRASVGANITAVKVKYVVGTEELENLPQEALVVDATYDASTGNYEARVGYESPDAAISWSTYAVFADGVEKIFKDPSTNKEVLSLTREENGNVRYYWTNSKGTGYWDTVGNWDEEPNRSYNGYPGVVAESGYFTSVACFTNSATVNLNGGSFRLWDYEGNNAFPRGLEFAKPTDEDEMKVSFTNGRLQMVNGGSGHSNPLLGGNGITVEFANNGIYDYSGNLAFAPGTTIIFSGNSTQPWKYNPANKGTGATTFVVKDGTVVSSYGAESVSSTHTAIIQNGTWVITQPGSKGIANVTKFIDGTSQARLALGDNATSFKTKTLKLTGTFEFTFAENQMSKAAYILPHSLVDGSQNATFKVDATAYKSGAKVPMVAVAVATDFIPKLQVFANGVDVTSDRNAKLVWEGTTLYFQQDSQNAASIGTTEYATLGEALEAATAGATIKVLNDCTADTAYVIANKTLTIDLNGKTVKANDTAAATDGNGVFWVQAGGVLTLEDSSEDKTGTVDGNGGNDYKMAIWADGGKVVINAGNYVNDNDGTQNQYDLIYVKNGGEIVINGGTFKCDSPRWTLNSHNTKTGTFVVTGGKFYQYNPTDFDTDEAVTTWCDAKYRAEADGEWYVIKEGYIVTTEPEASAVTVTADTEAEALEQVEFSVTAPEGVDATAYENYFKLVATETAEGSKTWIVALALKDELKPVIAETTPAITFNENGTVTVNIENELPGLNYGVRYATTVEAVETATPVAGFTVTPAEGDTAGFFKVVVDFKEIK